MKNINLNRINRFVLWKQHLADDSRIDDVVQIVKDVGGLHATGSKVPYLSLFARTRNFVKESLDEELIKESLDR